MGKRSKIVYIVGSVIIGITALLIVLFVLMAGGVIDARQTKLVFSSESATFVYDGAAHKATNWSIVDGELKEGHTAVVTMTGSETDVGTSSNYFSVVIQDEGGADVTGNYELEYQFGTITVVPRSIEISSHSHTKEYDGAPLVCDCGSEEVFISDGGLVNGHILSYELNGDSITGFGAQDNGFTYKIIDTKGKDVTYNYSAEYAPGTLSVEKRAVQIKSLSDSAVYSGEYLTADGYEILKGEAVEGEVFEAVFGNGIKTVGSASNEFTMYVYGEEGENLSENYYFDYIYGTLEVTPRIVTVITESDTKVYDGTPLENSSFRTEGTFADGQIENITVTGSQTFAGTGDNTVEIFVFDSEGFDVSDNYEFKVTCGSLTVLKRPVTIVTATDNKIYDGDPLENPEYGVDGSFAETDNYSITVTGSQTNAGESENTVDIKVWDVDGIDLTENYDFALRLGTLRVIPRPIYVYTEGAEKFYDGTPLTLDAVETEGEFVATHTYTVKVTGSQTDAGSSDNTVDITVFDGDGIDVYENYYFYIKSGTLTVYPLALDIYTASEVRYYDATPLTNENYDLYGTVASSQELYVNVTGSQTNAGLSPNYAEIIVRDELGADVTYNYTVNVYEGTLEILKREITVKTFDSDKDYDGEELTRPEYELYGEIVSGQTPVVTVTGSITDAGQERNEVELKVYGFDGGDVTENYNVTYDEGTLEIRPVYIFIVTQSDAKPYDGTPLTNSLYELSGTFVYGQTAVITVTGSQLMPGTSANTVEVIVFGKDNSDVTKNYEILKQEGTLEVTAKTLLAVSAGDEKVYDGTPLTNSDYEISGLAENHRASVVVTGSQTDAGESFNYFTVKITDEAGSDITAGYDIKATYGLLKVNYRNLNLVTDGAEKEYDGTPLTNSEYELSGNLADGQTVEVRVTGSQTSAGSSYNTAEVVILDESGIVRTDNYNINCEYGMLTVYGIRLSIATYGDTKTYDGTPLTKDGYVQTGSVADGQTLEVNVYGSQTDAGSGLNSADISITDADGKDVTGNYEISFTAGTLTVIPVTLTVTTATDSKYYDGTPLTNDGSRVDGTPAEGDSVTVTVVGEITEAGSVINKAVIEIKNKNGESVLRNYDIVENFGTLTVYARRLTVTTYSATKVYDGTPLVNTEYRLDGDLGDGHISTVTVIGTITDAGSVKNTAVVQITDGNGNDVTENYEISENFGTLTVEKISLVLVTGTVTRAYDGTPLTDGTFNVQGSLADGDIYAVEVFGEITDVGSVKNSATISITNGDKDSSANYDIIYAYGTLTVTARRISVETLSSEKIYDGTPLSCPEWNLVSLTKLADGDSFNTVEMPASITDAGSVENYIADFVIVNSEGKDVTFNYYVNENYGALTVTKRKLTIQTASDSKDYDGTPLTNPDWTITSITKPVTGHTVDVAVSGTRTEVGESKNTIAEVIIYKGAVYTAENDVTKNYEITYELGSLVIKGNTAQSGGNLDLSGDISDENADKEPTLAFKVYSEKSESLYFRAQSQGDYNYRSWLPAKEYGQTFQYNGASYSMNYLTSLAVMSSGAEATNVKIENFTNDYILPYYLGFSDGYVRQTSDVSFSGAIDGIYSADIYSYDDGASYSLGSPYSSYEELYRQFVYDNYTDVPEDTLEYFRKVINDNGFFKNSYNIVNKVATFIQKSATYNLDYNRTLDSSADVAVSFLRDYKEGVCRHYASAATLLFRAIGIPARITIGYYAETVAGDWVEVSSKNAHAWTEVYIDGLGWIAVEVTGSDNQDGEGGEGGEENPDDPPVITRELVVYAVNEFYAYDGNEHFHSGQINGLGLPETYTVETEVSGSRTAPGKTDCYVTKILICDGEGNDVTDDYTYKFIPGVLQVYSAILTIETGSSTMPFDGVALTNPECSIVQGELLPGHRIKTFVTTGKLEKIGSVVNTYILEIVDENGDDVTECYRLLNRQGLLTFTPIPLTVTAGSATKVNDGTPLTCDSWECSGTLLDGHKLIVEINTVLNGIGRKDNVISFVKVVDENGNDVSSDYLITKVNGKLTITP